MNKSEAVLRALTEALGDDVVLPGSQVEARYFGDWTQSRLSVRPAALIRPRSTAQVSSALKICDGFSAAIVPQGGRTGLAGGATPDDDCVILSLERMCAIGELDRAAGTLIVEAGAVLQNVQAAADAEDMIFPLDIAGRGSCTIGGNISTNAGGNRVLRYGMMRDLVLGLEVVLADGTVLTSMNKMLKNNAGYDLKQLFVGSEGTLGVVTRAVLRVFPKRPNVKICLCALRDYDAVIALLNSARVHLGDKLTAFEAMWPDFYQLATEGRGRRAPIAAQHGAYVLLETMGRFSDDMDGELATFVESAFEEGVIEDAVIAQSLAENDDLWSVRDSVGEFQRSLGPFIAFDVSVPIGDMGNFVDACGRKLAAAFPQTKVVFFGHIADSNIHICVATGALDIHALDTVVYDCVAEFSGSISAEHGIGLLKRAFLDRSRTSAEIETMRRLKRALDPNGVLNPGKVISVA